MSHLGPRTGQLYMRFGPVSSGKSSWLRARAVDCMDKGLKVLYINSNLDKRETIGGDDFHTTHRSDCKGLPDGITKVRVCGLMEVDVSAFQIIVVDECQFFNDLVVAVLIWLHVCKKTVFCAGLDLSFLNKPFGETLELSAHADKSKKLNATCDFCLEHLRAINYEGNLRLDNAPYTAKIGGDLDSEVEIGGRGLYKPACRYHYYEHSAHLKSEPTPGA